MFVFNSGILHWVLNKLRSWSILRTHGGLIRLKKKEKKKFGENVVRLV